MENIYTHKQSQKNQFDFINIDSEVCWNAKALPCRIRIHHQIVNAVGVAVVIQPTLGRLHIWVGGLGTGGYVKKNIAITAVRLFYCSITK